MDGQSLIFAVLAWIRELPAEAQTTLAIAVASAIISFFGIIVKRVFDSLSERSAYRREVFHNMFDKVHPLCISTYADMVVSYDGLSDSIKQYIALRFRDHADQTQTRGPALYGFYTYSLVLGLGASYVPLLLGNYEAEEAKWVLGELANPCRVISKRKYSSVFDDNEISLIENIVSKEDKFPYPFLKFKKLCDVNSKLGRLFKR